MKLQGRSTISYILRNIPHLLCVLLPAALFTSFFYNSLPEAHLFEQLVTGRLNAENYINSLLDGITILRFGKNWFWMLCSIAFLAFCMSVTVEKIDTHMRVGKMNLLPVKRAIKIFPNMLLYIFCWFVVSEIFMLVIVGIIYMLGFINSVTALISIAFALQFVARVVLAYMFGLLIMTFPLGYSEDYRFNIAMSYSARSMVKLRPMLLGISFAYVFAHTAVMALAYLLEPYGLHILLYTLTYVMLFMYVPCFAFKQYYDSVGGERRDIPLGEMS